MESLSKITYSVISLVVIVVLIATVAIPIVNDAVSEQVTAKNNEEIIYKASYSSTTDQIVISINASFHPVINGVEDTSLDVSASTITNLVFTDTGIVITTETNGRMLVTAPSVSTIYLPLGSTVTFSAGTVTTYNISSEQSTTLTNTYNSVYYPDDKGSLGSTVISSSSVKYVNKDKDIVLILSSSTLNASWTTGQAYIVYTMGVGIKQVLVTYYADSEIKTINSKEGFEVTFSNLKQVDEQLYSFEYRPTVKYTGEGGLTTTSQRNLIPIEYTYISQTDDMIRTLLTIIPLIMMIIPIMIVVGMISTRRD